MITLRARVLAIIVPAVFAAGIGSTVALGLWKTETSKEPARYVAGEFAGQANPADIRGSYTFADVSAAFPRLTVPDLARAFGVKGDAAAFAVKSLEQQSVTGPQGATVGTDSVRLFVALALGLPYDAPATTGLPSAAVDLLAARGLEGAALADARARIVDGTAPATVTPAATEKAATPAPAAPPPAAPSAAAPESPAAADRAVKGKTTFGELSGWGVKTADLRNALGADPGAAAVTLKDFCSANGLEFSTVRSAVQALVDAAD